MENQANIFEILPDEFKNRVRRFADDEFDRRTEENSFPRIKNRYEAFGIMTECMNAVNSAVKQVKTGIDGCTTMLPYGDGEFFARADIVYSALLDVIIAAANMSVNVRNAVYQDAMAPRPMLPLEELSLGEGEYDSLIDDALADGAQEPEENIDENLEGNDDE